MTRASAYNALQDSFGNEQAKALAEFQDARGYDFPNQLGDHHPSAYHGRRVVGSIQGFMNHPLCRNSFIIVL